MKLFSKFTTKLAPLKSDDDNNTSEEFFIGSEKTTRLEKERLSFRLQEERLSFRQQEERLSFKQQKERQSYCSSNSNESIDRNKRTDSAMCLPSPPLSAGYKRNSSNSKSSRFSLPMQTILPLNSVSVISFENDELSKRYMFVVQITTKNCPNKYVSRSFENFWQLHQILYTCLSNESTRRTLPIMDPPSNSKMTVGEALKKRKTLNLYVQALSEMEFEGRALKAYQHFLSISRNGRDHESDLLVCSTLTPFDESKSVIEVQHDNLKYQMKGQGICKGGLLDMYLNASIVFLQQINGFWYINEFNVVSRLETDHELRLLLEAYENVTLFTSPDSARK